MAHESSVEALILVRVVIRILLMIASCAAIRQ